MCKFYKSTDNGASFTVRSTGWLSLNTNDQPLAGRNDEGGRLAVTSANANRIYAYLIGETKSGDAGHIGLWKSDNAGENWTLVSPQVGSPYSSSNLNLANYAPTTGGSFWQGFYNLAMMASPTNADALLLGNLSLYRSTNAGMTMTAIGGYAGSSGIHPDFQGMAAKGSDAWLSCDGGVTYSTDFFAGNYQVRETGIIASEYWGFGQGWNQDIMVGGRYHNGNAVLSSNYPTGKSITLGGGEAPTGYVNPSTNVAYFSDISAKQLPTDFNGSVSNVTSFTKYPDESYYAAYSSDVEFDPRYYKHIYLGNDKRLWKSTDNGVVFNELKNFDNGSSECGIREIEVSRSNPNVIYVHVKTAYSGASLFRSADGGTTWTEKAFPTTPDKRHGSISLSATDENKLWVIFTNGSNGNKVYRTDDGGTTWTNITSSVLDGQSLHTVLNQAGTNDVYVGSGEAVYRYAGSTWSTFNTGLPSYVDCNLLRGYYRTNKLRVSTYGNGIWESDFAAPAPPVAQPMVDKSTTNCSRNIFYFDSTDNNTLTFSANNNITSFSQFILTNNAALPIELLDFKAVLINQKVEISWQVADEKDVNHYLVERSFDGKTFELFSKQAKGIFQTVDRTPQYGVTYYRLKVVENDGRYSYAPIRSVDLEQKQKTAFKIYPNPTADILNIQFNAERSQVVDFELINAIGQIVHAFRIDSKMGDNYLYLNTSFFPAGLYSLRIQQGNIVTVEKIVLK